MRGGRRDVVKENFGAVRGAYIVAGVLSCAVNVLMLTGPLFMLQVYDRVLTSQSVPTLLVLLGLAIALYVMMGVFDFLRARILSRVSQRLDADLAPIAFRSWMTRSLAGAEPGYRPIQDLGLLRGFLSSPTVLALFDLPWFPIYLGVVYLLHFQLGLLATAGACVVIVLALLNEALTGRAAGQAATAEVAETRFADQAQKGADALLAMGMVSHATGAWRDLRNVSLVEGQQGTERSEVFTASSKAFRLLLQSCILALGGYLAIQQEITAGMIVAASILAGRALAPIDQVIGGWRAIKRARLARRRLSDYLARDSAPAPVNIRLPDPTGQLEVAGIVKRPPRPDRGDLPPILSGVSFKLGPGDGLGVIGPSASGKTTLAKLLVGLWMPDQGSVRLDGATFEHWQPDDIGRHVGYLPQTVVLMAGTIAQNIARFDPEARNEDIVDAAQLAGVHDMILGLPDGYATIVDHPLSPLTGGQRQRIALARAIYRMPVLVVLDEPNSNLDADGDQALTEAIRKLRANGSVVIVMAHRPSAIAAVDRLLMLKEGRMLEFGDKEDVLKKVTRSA